MEKGEPIMQTFGDHVNQFANSVDIVPSSVYEEVLCLIQDYLKDNLDAVFFAVLIDSIVMLKPHLVSEFPNDRRWWMENVKDDQGKYKGQIALAYGTGKPIWIVGENKEKLTQEKKYIDLLGNVDSEEIPKFEHIRDIETKTSIILPLKIGDNHFGVINVELRKYMPRSNPWLSELRKLANAIAILHRLKEINTLQKDSTNAAKDCLKDGVTDKVFLPVIEQHKMFFASSSRADDEVVGLIKEVLNMHETDFELVHWTEISHGNIHDEIWEHISSCTYGICYFSEPEPEGPPHRFRDNPNVLFEAGMLFALRKARRIPLKAILLVREPNTTPIPFDLNAEYITPVPRLAEGRLNEQMFRKKLLTCLSTMLNKK